MTIIDENKIKQIWNESLDDLKLSLGQNAIKNWISKLSVCSLEDGMMKFSTSSNFIKDTVLSRYSSEIIDVLNSYGCSIRAIFISVSESPTSLNNNPSDDDIDEKQSETEHNDDNIVEDLSKEKEREREDFDSISILDKRFTFDNFVVGKPNEFAYAAALRVSESDFPPFNPLFLYGGVGLGKTHLMHAIAWQIRKLHPDKKIIYISAEKFMYLFIRSLRYKNSMSFKEMFRNVDILMIDDVQFISGKDTTQEEFFHTFNDLVDNNRQVIISADKSPSDLDGMEERLKSRLGWGLVADIHPTTYELRLGILQSKAKKHAISIPEKVLDFLAFKITSNIRELEGALNRIVAHSTLVGREITIDVAQEVLRDLLRANEKFITIEGIQRKVCEYFSIKLSDLTSSKRLKTITKARHVAMYLSKQLTTKSLPEIGRSFGGKDHATVIHAVKKVKELMEEDKEFAVDLEILRKSLES